MTPRGQRVACISLPRVAVAVEERDEPADLDRSWLAIGGLATRYLPLPAPTLEQLRVLGITKVHAYAALPAAAILPRFGYAGLRAYRLAHGQDDPRVLPWTAEPALVAHHSFAEPIANTRSLRFRLEQLARDLAGPLGRRADADSPLHERRGAVVPWRRGQGWGASPVPPAPPMVRIRQPEFGGFCAAQWFDISPQQAYAIRAHRPCLLAARASRIDKEETVPYFLTSLAALLAQNGNDDAGLIAALFSTTYFFCCALPFYVLSVIGLWQMFVKAGRPGWPALIPFYNLWVAFEVSGHPGWWMLGIFVPILNIIVMIILCYHLALSFGKGIWTTLGLYFLPFITTLWLGFGDAQYVGPAGARSSTL